MPAGDRDTIDEVVLVRILIEAPAGIGTTITGDVACALRGDDDTLVACIVQRLGGLIWERNVLAPVRELDRTDVAVRITDNTDSLALTCPVGDGTVVQDGSVVQGAILMRVTLYTKLYRRYDALVRCAFL